MLMKKVLYFSYTFLWRLIVARQILALAALMFVPLIVNAQNVPAAPSGREQELEQLIDRAIPPETVADAIVDFLPDFDMRLDVASAGERSIPGRVIKHERGPSPLPAIVHTANTIIRPLEAGKPVKLFLKQYPGRSEYYVIAVLPVSYTYEGQP